MNRRFFVLVLLAWLVLPGCHFVKEGSERQARLCLFIGVDISGSFLRGRYFDDSIRFLAHYLYTHLQGLGAAEQPQALFVGSIGGAKLNEAKTFFPIQTFENKSIPEIETELRKIFPKNIENPITDYNAFFRQIGEFVRNKNLMLRPISIVMLTDGYPSLSAKDRKPDFNQIEVMPLENLSRNVTLRVLYTNADIAMGWSTKVPRRRVKIWSQDAKVMVLWSDPKILLPGKPFAEQARFFDWLQDNVDFPVRAKRVTVAH